MAKTFSVVAVLVAASFAFVTPSFAANISNEDSEERVVQIHEGDDVKEVTIKAGETLENVCNEGCVLVMGDEELELEGGETVKITDGALTVAE